MAIGNRSNRTGSSTEPNRRRGKLSRAMPGLLGLAIFAAATGLLFAFISTRSNSASREIVKPAGPPSASVSAPTSAAAPTAAKPPASPPVKATGPVPGKRSVTPKSVAVVRAHAKLFGSQAGPPAEMTIKLPPLDFSRLASPPIVKPSSSTTAEATKAAADAPVANGAVVTTDEFRDANAEEARERQERAEKRKLIDNGAANVKPSVAAADTAEPLTKGAEFRARVEKRSATTTTTELGGVAQSIALQAPPSSFKPEISKPAPVASAEFKGDVRSLPQYLSDAEKRRIAPPRELGEDMEVESKTALPGAPPEAPQKEVVPLAPMPAPTVTFKGLDHNTWGAGWPPDTVGDVGPFHYIQAVNTSIGIFNKTTGAQLAAFTFNSLWSTAGTGTACDNSHQGDPTVIYDPLDDRFIVADFAFTGAGTTPPFYECIAVSKTADPVGGGWWLYAIRTDDATHPWFADYPKMGIWPDGLYMGANMFDSTNTFKEVRAWAFNRSDLVSGVPVRTVVVDFGVTTYFTVLPSNFRGTPPPAGRENLFISESQTLFAYHIFKFHVDYSGSGSTFTGPTNVSQTSYTVAPTTAPTPANSLDTLRERLMMQAQYVNLAGVESLWVNHTVRSGASPAPNGIQWAQINVTGGTIVSPPVQQQIYGNVGSDGVHRWMGALAVDKDGNMALGYSASSATLNPDIRYAGRLATDALNGLPQTETSLIPAAVTRGSQSGNCGGSTCIRWGDYSAMTVDPDGCTFWYTQEYYETTGLNWQTRFGSFKFPTCISLPTAAKVQTFTATPTNDGRVLIQWRTGTEVDNLGFNVYREQDGIRTRITPQLVAGSALQAAADVTLTSGNKYAWADTPAQGKTVRYYLEDIDLKGKRTLNGPISLSGSNAAPTPQEATLLTRLGFRQAQLNLGVSSAPIERSAKLGQSDALLSSPPFPLAGGAAVKLSVNREGWYRITQADLVAAGLDPNVNPRFLQLFVDGREVPIKVQGEQDNRFDAADSVGFYGVGLDAASSDTHVYWLAAGSQPGQRIEKLQIKGLPTTATSFPYTVERKDRSIYFAGLRNGDVENFFGAVIAAEPVDQSLNLQRVNKVTTASAQLEVALQGVTEQQHQVKVFLNGAEVGAVNFGGQAQGVVSLPIPHNKLIEGDNIVRLIAQAGETDVSLVNAVRITYQHTYSAESNALRLTANGAQQVAIDGFTSSDVQVFDVTNPNAPQEVAAVVQAQKGSYSVVTTAPGSGQRTLFALTGARARQVLSARANQPSTWRQPLNGANLLIITHRNFAASTASLKALRQSQGLSVAVIDVDDLFDEFSYGNKTPQAIKDFLAYAKGNWKKPPQYALLVGDASYDPKNYLGFGDSDFVPTKLIDTQYLETVSDDWLADFSGGGVAELAIGRLPVRTPQEATAMINKIISYDKGTPSDSVLLIADRNDGYNFGSANTFLRSLVPPELRVQEVDRNLLDDATAKSQLLTAINRGQKIVNYTGHGSTDIWRAQMLTNDDALGLSNSNLSLFITMTCLNGFYQDPLSDGLAESLMKSSRGGAVAVWASSGMTAPNGQSVLNQQMYRFVFDTSLHLTLGEATMRAKALVSDPDVRRTWILFGDPSMRLK